MIGIYMLCTSHLNQDLHFESRKTDTTSIIYTFYSKLMLSLHVTVTEFVTIKVLHLVYCLSVIIITIPKKEVTTVVRVNLKIERERCTFSELT